MCYSGLCQYENYQGDCTWNARHPYPCPDGEEDIQTGTQKLAKEAAEAYEKHLASLGD